MIHRQVVEVVERGEDGELREARHTRHHHEADVRGVILNLAVERRERRADGRGLRGVTERGADRRVVLVDEHDHGLAALPGQETNGIGEVPARRHVRVVNDIGHVEGLAHALHESDLELLKRLHAHRGEVEVQDGILRPVVVQLVDGLAREKLALATEDALQRGKHQRLAEAPRPRDEVETAPRITDQLVQNRGLVHIDTAISPQLDKVCDVLCDVAHVVSFSVSIA